MKDAHHGPKWIRLFGVQVLIHVDCEFLGVQSKEISHDNKQIKVGGQPAQILKLNWIELSK